MSSDVIAVYDIRSHTVKRKKIGTRRTRGTRFALYTRKCNMYCLHLGWCDVRDNGKDKRKERELRVCAQWDIEMLSLVFAKYHNNKRKPTYVHISCGCVLFRTCLSILNERLIRVQIINTDCSLNSCDFYDVNNWFLRAKRPLAFLNSLLYLLEKRNYSFIRFSIRARINKFLRFASLIVARTSGCLSTSGSE